MGLLGTVLKAGSKAALVPVDDFLNKIGTAFLTTQFGGQSVFGHKLKDTLATSIGIAGALSEQLTALITPDKPSVPNITFLEAEGVFTGTMTDRRNLNVEQVTLAQPGSKKSIDSNVKWQNYPFYNEALGVFAVLEKPKIYLQQTLRRETTGGPRSPIRITTYYNQKIAFQKLKYTFNPAAEVDEEKTKIYAALVITTNNVPLPVRTEIKNVGLLDTFTNNLVFITPFVPLEYLNQIVPNFSSTNVSFSPKVKLRLMIEYTFKANKHGKVNKSLQILTYPVKTIATTDVDYIGLSYKDWGSATKTLPATNFTQSTTITALDSIIVSGNLTAAPGTTIQLVAPKVVVFPNVKVSPNVQLKNMSPFSYRPPVTAVAASEVKAFCKSSAYHANVAYLRARIGEENIKEYTTKLHSAYPNPFNQSTIIPYTLEESGAVKLWVSNILGEKVALLVDQEKVSAGNYAIEFKAQGLPAGIYLYTLQTNRYQSTQRFVLTR